MSRILSAEVLTRGQNDRQNQLFDQQNTMFLDSEDLGQLSKREVELSYNCLKERDCFYSF